VPVAHRSSRLRLTLVGSATAALLLPLSVTSASAQTPAAVPSGTTVTGQLVQAYADPHTRPAAKRSQPDKPLSWIEPAHGTAVRVPTDQVADLPLGATVAVKVGAQVTDAATTESGIEPAHQVLTATVVRPAMQPDTQPDTQLATTYTNNVTVVKVLPGGATGTADPTTVQTVIDAVNGPVNDFWGSQSRGTISLHATAGPDNDTWYQAAAGCDQPTALWDEVAQHVGFVSGAGKHLLLYIPQMPADPNATDPFPNCEYGLGEVGMAPADGGRMYVRDTATSVIAHELGHNFGLGHSSELQCDASIDGGDNCGVAEYWDLYDVMGMSWGPIGSLSAPQADLIGLLPPAEVRDLEGVRGTQDVTLTPMSGTGGTRAIRLGASDGLIYWLEYRSATGQDAWLSDPNVNDQHLQTGVLLRVEQYADDTSLLLDGTPSPEAGWDADMQTALTSGRSVWLSALDYYVTVKSIGTQAVVRVQAGDAALTRDFNRNYLADLVTADSSGNLYLYPGNGSGGFGGRATIGKGWQARDLITMVGDWDGTGNSQDLIARDPSGNLWFYPGNGHGGFLAARVIGKGWQIMSGLLSPGDWNGDGNVDLIARRRSDNALLLYPGNGAGGFGASSVIGNGWGAMTAFVVSGDWDTNGTTDFIVRRNDGALLLYSGNGRGGFTGSRVIGNGWNIFTAITGVGDWDGDGLPDLLARKTDGSLLLYPGNGMGGFAPSRKIGSGWGGFRLAV